MLQGQTRIRLFGRGKLRLHDGRGITEPWRQRQCAATAGNASSSLRERCFIEDSTIQTITSNRGRKKEAQKRIRKNIGEEVWFQQVDPIPKASSKKAGKKRSVPSLLSKAKKALQAVITGAAAGGAKGAVEGAADAGSKATGIAQASEGKPTSESSQESIQKKEVASSDSVLNRILVR